MHIYMYMATIG